MAQSVRRRALSFSHLQVLAVLLEERHISRTADRLAVTQSSISKSLATLRQQFNDPLLVRAPGGYELTHKARAIQDKLSTLLAGLGDLYQDTANDPAIWHHEFRISMADDVALVLLPQIVARLQGAAPHITISVIGDIQNALGNLHSNKIDLVVDTMPDRRQGLVGNPMCDWHWKCVMSEAHACAEALSYDDYISANHGLVSFAGDKSGIVDLALGRWNASRRVNLVVPYFAAIPGILEVSDTIFTVPAPIEQHFRSHAHIASQPVPLDVEPLQLSLIWHPRHTNDSAHTWLRELVSASVRQVEPEAVTT